MARSVSKAGGRHYWWGAGCEGLHLVEDASLSVIRERMPPGTAEARHLHSRARQFFFVLAGSLTIEVEGVRHALQVGDGLEIAPGEAHQVLNAGAVDAGFLVVSQPPAQGDRAAV